MNTELEFLNNLIFRFRYMMDLDVRILCRDVLEEAQMCMDRVKKSVGLNYIELRKLKKIVDEVAR